MSWRHPATLTAHADAGRVPGLTAREYKAFRADVRARGVVTPVEVDENGVIVDGHHRVRAARELGLETVPVIVVEVDDELDYLLSAALQRRHLTASQKAMLALELDEYRQARKRARRGKAVTALPPTAERSREIAARLGGVSARTVQDAVTVRNHDATLAWQVTAGAVPVHRAARAIRREQRDQQLSKTPRLPRGSFDLIYADPPWQLGNPDGDFAPENHYPTLSLNEIKTLPIPAAEDAVLFLWAVSCHLPQALAVMSAWGFDYRNQLVWVKESIGLGTWVRHRHELLLIGRRGNYPPPDPRRRVDSVLEAPRGRHSEKPLDAYQAIERMYPHATKLELYARGTPRKGWTAWGNEVAA